MTTEKILDNAIAEQTRRSKAEDNDALAMAHEYAVTVIKEIQARIRLENAKQ